MNYFIDARCGVAHMTALLAFVVTATACGNVGTKDTTQPVPFGDNGANTGPVDTGTSSSSGGNTGNTGTQCTPAARNCKSLAELSTCNAKGEWETTACGADNACDNAECLPIICKPGAISCDGAKIVECSARGTTQVVKDVCVANKTCIGGECTKKVCEIGESKCVGNAVVTCTEDKEWFKSVCGAKETCATKGGVDGVPTCIAHICEPGGNSCQDDKVFSCSADGLTKSLVADCATQAKDGAAQVCFAGACTAKHCVAGDKKCVNGEIASCKNDFSGWQLTPCEKGLTCGGDDKKTVCMKPLCANNEVFCDGLNVMKCNATGTVKEQVQACNGNLQECKNGGCTDLAIVCGDGFCDEGESLENCNKDCTQKITIAPDFDKLPAGIWPDLPQAPRGLNKPMPQAAYTSSTMAVGGKWLYVVDRDNGTVVLMDRVTLKVGHTLKVGGQPEHIIIGKDGTAWISVKDDDAIVKLKAGATSMVDAVKWQVGMEPIGMALDHSGKLILVALFGEGAVIGIDPISGKELARAKTKAMPRGVAIGMAGFAAVTHGSGVVGKIDVNKFKQGNILKPVITTTTYANLRVENPVKVCRGITDVTKRVPNRGVGVAIQPESGMMLFPHVLVNAGTAADTLASAGVKPKVKKPKPIAVTTCSSSGYGSTCKTTLVTPAGPPPCVSAPVRPYEVSVTQVTPDMGFVKPTVAGKAVMDKQTKRHFLSRYDQPGGMTHHPTMTMAFVTSMGTNNMLVLNTAAADPMMWPIADIKVGLGPKSVVISPDGKKAWVHNSTAFTISEVDLAPLLKFNDPLTNGKAMPKIEPLFMQHTKQVAYAKDPLSKKGAIGRQVFHNASNARLSAANRFACATCHLDGMEDKQVWFVGEGPRQTPALAGRLKDTAPFNWMGTKFTLHDNIKNTTTRMGGTGLMPGELEALAVFLKEGLVPPRNPNIQKGGGLTTLQQQGKKLYDDPVVGCNTCHSGPGLTDGAQHDVGTATKVEVQVQKIFAGNDPPNKVLYNTPSLRGLFYTAPYLHDGSAPTLKDALKKTAKTMGKTSHLNDKQLDALVAYLKTL